MATSELLHKRCSECTSKTPRLDRAVAEMLLADLDGWRIVDNHHLQKVFVFPDWKRALAFVNELSVLAEEENHHPDVHLSWGRVQVTLWTHTIDALSENDFIVAAKADQIRS